ncbi:MAG TPA: hypothetical protein VHE55_10855 [Fimbriimonadaceae bacterium]|nr:hypothetical protein [Fimbriimonadaceae bacterium]
MKPRSRKRVVLPVLVVLVLAVAVVITVRAITSVHIAPIGDAEIAAVSSEFKPVEAAEPTVPSNTISEIVESPDAIREGDFDMRGWLPARLGEIRASTSVTDALQRATKGKRLAPGDPNWENDRETIESCYEAQLKAEAIYDPNRCCRAACGAADYCSFLTRSHLSNGDVDQDVEYRLFKAIETAIASGVMSVRQVHDIYARLTPAPAEDVGLANKFRREFADKFLPLCLSFQRSHDADGILKAVFQGSLDTRNLAVGDFDVRQTVAEAADEARAEVKNASRPWVRRDEGPGKRMRREMDSAPAPPNPGPADSWLSKMWARIKYQAGMRSIPNSLGRTLFHLFDFHPNELSSSIAWRTDIEAHRLIVLLQLYKQMHRGSLPTTLGELASIDPSIPMPRDLYSGGEFLYSAANHKFWSVGENGKDDGGSFSLDRSWPIP